MTLLSDHARHVTLTDDQFGKLVELLTPGYECSKLMLAELQARAPQPDTPPEEKPWPEGDTLVPPHPEQSGKPKAVEDIDDEG